MLHSQYNQNNEIPNSRNIAYSKILFGVIFRSKSNVADMKALGWANVVHTGHQAHDLDLDPDQPWNKKSVENGCITQDTPFNVSCDRLQTWSRIFA